MFGIDVFTFETVWPSVLCIGVMAIGMVWALVKIRRLIKRDLSLAD